MHGKSLNHARVDRSFRRWINSVPITELEYINPSILSKDLGININEIYEYLNDLCENKLALKILKVTCPNDSCNEEVFVYEDSLGHKYECEDCFHVFTPKKYIEFGNGNYNNIRGILYEVNKEDFLEEETKNIRITDILKVDSSKEAKVIELKDNKKIEVIKTEDKILEGDKMKKIFISHSSKNKNISDYLYDLLKKIGVKSNNIYYSSREETGADYLDSCLESISDEFKNNELLVILMLSNEFYKSDVCLAEMGATWVTTNQYIPIIIPPLGYSNIRGVIDSMKNSIALTDPSISTKLDKFKKTIEEFIGLDEVIELSEWTTCKDEFIKNIKSISSETEELTKRIVDIKVNGNIITYKVIIENNTKLRYQFEDAKVTIKMKDGNNHDIEINPEVISSMAIQPFEHLTLFMWSELETTIKRVNIDLNKSSIEIGYYESM